MSSTRRIATVAIVAVLGVLGGCGDDGTDETATTMATDAQAAAFDDLPLLPGSEPFGAPSEAEGVIARSYETSGNAPSEVIDFYAEHLPDLGWDEAEPVFREDTALRADFVDDAYRLEISALEADRPASSDDEPGGAQYSLVLRPR